MDFDFAVITKYSIELKKKKDGLNKTHSCEVKAYKQRVSERHTETNYLVVLD